STEFKVREADYGSYPKGLLYGLDALDSWLYDERAPFVHLDALAVLKELKEELEKGYFEELIRSYLLDNPHASVVVVKPKRGLVQEREEALAKRLAEYKSTLSGEELRTLAEETEHLHIYQDTPSTQEELLTLPLLAREDLKSKVRPIRYEKRSLRGRDHIFCERDTCGVAYLSAIFRISREEEALTPEITFFCHLIGAVDTANYGYGEFANEVNLHSGGLSVNVHIYPKDDGSYDCTLDARAKYLYDEEETVMALFEEMLLQSDFSDRERIRQLLRMEVSSMQVKLMSAGHTLSANRAGSYFADDLKRLDEAGGIAYYEYLKDFEEHFDERIEDFQRLCRALVKRTFTNDRLLTCSICEKEQEDSMEGRILAFAEALEAAQEGSGEDAEKVLRRAAHKTPEEPRINEGICTASQVQYVSCAGNFKKGGFSFNGAWRVLRMLLNYEYFWLNIRVKGGAYGCMSSFQRSGNVTFSSYRDPSLSETYAIFAGTADYLKELIISERDMTKYVIGTVSALDTPLSPSQDGLRSLTSYLTGVDEAMLQRERDEVLACSVEDLRSLDESVRFLTYQGFVCAIGNEEVLKKGASLFNEVISMG
ncbi:MAG: insulinase family protein, partial [Lachnospiraceae bacterium]|nr:insulinase family protein [Lachnospiraceae bacterium]